MWFLFFTIEKDVSSKIKYILFFKTIKFSLSPIRTFRNDDCLLVLLYEEIPQRGSCSRLPTSWHSANNDQRHFHLWKLTNRGVYCKRSKFKQENRIFYGNNWNIIDETTRNYNCFFYWFCLNFQELTSSEIILEEEDAFWYFYLQVNEPLVNLTNPIIPFGMQQSVNGPITS